MIFINDSSSFTSEKEEEQAFERDEVGVDQLSSVNRALDVADRFGCRTHVGRTCLILAICH